MKKTIRSPSIFLFHRRQFASKKKTMREEEDLSINSGKSRREEDLSNNSGKSRRTATFGCGLAASGALGNPEFIDPRRFSTQLKLLKSPAMIPLLNEKRIRKVAAGFGFSLFANSTEVYGAGLNTNGQLGFHPVVDEENTTRNRQWLIGAEKIPGFEGQRIRYVQAGRAHSLVLTDTGIFGMGMNSLGQIGRPIIPNEDYGTNATIYQVKLPDSTPIVQVHCSLDTSFALLANGRLFAWGLGTDGQLGDGSYSTRWQPEQVAGDLLGEHIVQIAGGTDTLMAVSRSGDVFVWGQNEYGQLPNCSQPQVNSPRQLRFVLGRVVDVAATSTACLALNQEGNVFVWGYGIVGEGQTRRIPIASQLDQPLFGGPVSKIFAGHSHFATINAQGHLHVWGANRCGVLGVGDEKDRPFPFRVPLPGDARTVALGPDHTLITVAL